MNSKSTKLVLNLKEFLTEFFTDINEEKAELSYGLFWDAIGNKQIKIVNNYNLKEDGSFYYEYGLLKAEEELEADCAVIETRVDDFWRYKIIRDNAEEERVTYYFTTGFRIIAFGQHENEVMNLAAEMQEITQQKPILCLESHSVLFRGALNCIMEAYSKDKYNDEDLLKEHCPSNSEVAVDWMRYEFRGSHEYITEYCYDGYAIGNNVGYAIDAAWTWFHTGFVNNFISKDPETNLLHLNW